MDNPGQCVVGGRIARAPKDCLDARSLAFWHPIMRTQRLFGAIVPMTRADFGVPFWMQRIVDLIVRSFVLADEGSRKSIDIAFDIRYARFVTEPLFSGVPTAADVPKARVVERGDLLRSGQTIADRYEVRERLGRGGMGMVWRVYDRKLDEDVALKVILPDRIGDPTALARFRDEVKIARKITDSNVCRVFDIGESEHLAFLTMELIEGTTLRKLLANGPIEPLRAVDMLQQIVKGVAAAHEHGIIHRDIKPENVLVRHDGRCLVADFGLAYRPDTNTQENTAGTPAYMSPEQLRGESLDLRSDVFALGLVAFELLSGESPESARDVMTHGDLPPLGRVTASMQTALRTIIVRALAKDPKDRFDSATSFGIALSRITEQPVRQQPAAFRWRPWLIALPFLFVLFLILVSQLPRGDLREWHPFSPEENSQDEME